MDAAEPRRVYLNYTQAELDRAYDQRAWAANADEVIRRYGTASAATRNRLKVFQDVSYGLSSDQTLDIFPTSGGPSPVHVHVHGGGWRNLTKSEESFLADCLVPAGAILVVLNFSTIPKVRLPEMVSQIRQAIVWLHRHIEEYGGDPERIHVSGHSSGGHMAAVLLTTDWPRYGLRSDVIKSGLVMSGMYDLRPVMLSARSKYVKLSESEVVDLSPILHLEHLVAPITVAYGSIETPEFQRQACSFADAIQTTHKSGHLLNCGPFNHFEVLELLARSDTTLTSAALRMMGLAKPST